MNLGLFSSWRKRFQAVIAGMLLNLGSTAVGEVRLLGLTNFQQFSRSTEFLSESVILTSSELDPGFRWTELIASWNAATNISLMVEVRPTLPGAPFFSFGRWTFQPDGEAPRTSLNGQRASLGEMKTDTLLLKTPAERVQLRLTVKGPLEGLKRISLAFSGSGIVPSNEPFQDVWGRELTVPIRTQAEFPEGIDKWCSPTCTAMLLAYWGEQKERKDWLISVPDTARAVFDPGWGGTGNWPFNMAFVGSFPGMNSAVVRFGSLRDLEQWVAAGLPAAVSVSYSMLKGMKDATSGDGHLVVVRGFTQIGEVIVNDPGVRRERVRRVFPRADFERAWQHSGRTVYCVWPDGQPLPEGDVFPR